MGALTDLNSLLEDLESKVSGQIQGSLLASTDGFLITSTLRTDNADQIAAMVATTTGVSRRMTSTLNAGELSETTITGNDRLILLYLVGGEGVLGVVAKPGANVALINMNARDVAKEAFGIINQSSAVGA
jgi:hypothetical protein